MAIKISNLNVVCSNLVHRHQETIDEVISTFIDVHEECSGIVTSMVNQPFTGSYEGMTEHIFNELDKEVTRRYGQ